MAQTVTKPKKAREPQPWKKNGRGTWMLRRVFTIDDKSVLYSRASGTDDLKVWRQMHDVLDKVENHGREDILQALVDETLTPLVMFAKDQRGEMFSMSVVKSLRSMSDVLTTWLDKRRDIKEETRESYRYGISRFVRIASGDEPSDADEVATLRKRLKGDEASEKDIPGGTQGVQSRSGSPRQWTVIQSASGVRLEVGADGVRRRLRFLLENQGNQSHSCKAYPFRSDSRQDEKGEGESTGLQRRSRHDG